MQQTVQSAMSLKDGAEELITIEAGATVKEAVQAMAVHRVGAVLIRNEDGLVDGIFTERDVMLRVVHAGLDPLATPVSMVMTREVRFVSPATPVEAAMALMHMNRHRHLLVIDGPRVFGLISMGDMTNFLIRHGEGRFEAAVRNALPTAAEDTPAAKPSGDT